MAHPTRFERVTFAFGARSFPSEKCDRARYATLSARHAGSGHPQHLTRRVRPPPWCVRDRNEVTRHDATQDPPDSAWLDQDDRDGGATQHDKMPNAPTLQVLADHEEYEGADDRSLK